jgi:predicted acetyltransferase
MALAIERVGVESEEILANLLQHYLHDMSEFFPIDVGADGRYRYDTTPHWDNGDPVYLARADGALAGFAIVASAERWIGEAGVNDVKEFFVLRRHRRSGVGEAMARAIWGNHRGPWLVRVLEANAPAAAFWRRMIDQYTGGRYAEQRFAPDGRTRIFYRFDNLT